MSLLKIASVGTSGIMNVMQEAIALNDDTQCVLVYSRSRQRGKDYAASVGVKRSTDSFDELLGDKEANTVYIASPNVCHKDQAVAALKHKKHVILEKPSSLTEADSRLIFDTARKNGVFCFEAITTVYMPSYLEMKRSLKDLGKFRSARIVFGRYSSKYDDYLAGKNPNIMNPDLGGGALNDMGIYCVHTAVDLFGAPMCVKYDAEFGPNGVDLEGIVTLGYPDLKCVLETAKCRDLDSGCYLECENGYARSAGLLNEFRSCTISVGGEEKTVSSPNINRMVYELESFVKAIKDNDTELFERRAAQSIIAASILEKGHASSLL